MIMAPTPRKKTRYGNPQLREASPLSAGPNKNRTRHYHRSGGKEDNMSKLQKHLALGKANERNKPIQDANQVTPNIVPLASRSRKLQATFHLQKHRRELWMLKADLKNRMAVDVTTLEAAISATRKNSRKKALTAIRDQEHEIRKQVLQGSPSMQTSFIPSRRLPMSFLPFASNPSEFGPSLRMLNADN